MHLFGFIIRICRRVKLSSYEYINLVYTYFKSTVKTCYANPILRLTSCWNKIGVGSRVSEAAGRAA